MLAFAILLAQGVPEGDSRQEAKRLLTLAQAETGRGDYAAAMRHAADAADLYAAVADSSGQALAFNRAGQAALYAAEYSRAAEHFQRAVTHAVAAGDTVAHAQYLGNLGNVYFFVGRYSDAFRTYDAALALTNPTSSDAAVLRGRRIILASKASLLQRLGRDDEALAIYQELGSRTVMKEEEQAQMLVNLGVLYRRLGDPVKALSTYDEAHRLFARDRHVDGEIGVMKNRGIVLALDLEQLGEAERSFSEVIEVAARAENPRERLHGHLYRGETRLRAGRPDDARADFTIALDLATRLQTPEEEWKALYGLGRTEPRPEAAREYLVRAVTVIEQLRETIRIPSMRSDFFNDKSEVYDALITSRIDTAPAGDTFRLVERSYSRAWRDLLGLSAAVDLGAVQKALPDRVLLLDYWTSATGAAVVAVTKATARVIRVSVNQSDVSTLLDELASGTTSDWRAHSKALARKILPPSSSFDGIDQVVVVASGPLGAVPFEILDEQTAVTYTPTAATLLRPSASGSSWVPPWRTQLRAFADPVVPPHSQDTRLVIPARLPASGTEVRNVATELAGREELHLRADNRKAYLWQALQPPVVHIASHAMAASAALEQSRILFSSADGSSPEPDFLFLKEAYDLPFDGVELAVLSACDTERGRVVRGEGVQSFSRAFLAAGARTTVTTLWRVADEPTADFMQLFYHYLQRGLPRAEALRQSKLRFVETPSGAAHPHVWAAFVLSGDGLNQLPRAVPWGWIVGGVLVALFTTVATGFVISRRSAAAQETRNQFSAGR